MCLIYYTKVAVTLMLFSEHPRFDTDVNESHINTLR